MDGCELEPSNRTPLRDKLPGTTSTGVGISHSAPTLAALRMRPSRASLRTLRSDTRNRIAASRTVTLATSSAGTSDDSSNSMGLGSLSVLISWMRNPMTSPSSSSRLRTRSSSLAPLPAA